MDLYIKEKRFSLHHKMAVCDVEGNPLYEIHGKPVSVGAKMHICDLEGNELLYIHEKVPAMTEKFWLEKDGEQIAFIKRAFGPHHNFTIDGLDWKIEGDLFGHHYQILDAEEQEVCSIQSKALTWGDTYHLQTNDDVDVITCLGVVVALDAAEEAQQSGEAAGAGTGIGQVISHM